MGAIIGGGTGGISAGAAGTLVAPGVGTVAGAAVGGTEGAAIGGAAGAGIGYAIGTTAHDLATRMSGAGRSRIMVKNTFDVGTFTIGLQIMLH